MALVKAAASAVVLWTGFRAVSDDDFARTVIAEEWARSPRWDASGTSWLPLPFWISGAAMKLAGRSLDTARGVALVLGVVAALLVYAAARWMGEERGPATAGAVVAAVFPWSARLGVATVPELFTAALTLLAMAALVPAQAGAPLGGGRRLLLGGAALLAATLSRYEAWPVALIFAAICAADGLRSGAGRAAGIGAAALALAGPIAWLGWNRVRHGDALHFLARVAAYRQALGDGGAPGRLLGYPLAMVREEPEIVALFAAAALVTLAGGGVRGVRERLAPYARPGLIAIALIAALSLAMLKDGAPTHHPERAVLAPLLLIAVAGGALSARALLTGGSRLARGLALAGAVALAAGIGRRGPGEGFMPRADEVALGRALATRAPPGEPALVEVADYGYLAVEAALGRPEDAVPDRSVDPRDTKATSSFTDADALRRRLAASGARWVAARIGEPVRAVLGAPVLERGGWGAFAVEPPR